MKAYRPDYLSNTQSGINDVAPERVKKELKRNSEYFHVIGIWVAIIFDPVFGITDYFNLPQGQGEILTVRFSVSVISLFTYFAFKRGLINTYQMIAVPFVLISLQNGYTYRFIDSDTILGHNLNYLALFLGGGLFILWPWIYSILAVSLTLTAGLLFILTNEQVTFEEFAVKGGLLLLVGAVFSVLLIGIRYNLKKKEISARLALNDSLDLTEKQKSSIELKNEQLNKQAEELAEAKTKIEKANDQLKNHNDRLESRVSERTRELNTSNNEMKSLIYSLSHDFKTPVTNMRGLLDLSKADTENIAEYLELMDRDLNKFSDLLLNLQHFSIYKADDEHAETKKTKISPDRFVCDGFKRYEKFYSGRINLNIHPDVSSYELDTYTEKFKVLLYNILSNAVQFQDPKAAENRIAVYIENNNLVIEDNGIGIKPEQEDKIFQMFYRGSGLSKGAGLGLYISKGIADQLGAEITVRSNPGKGTKVMIQFGQ